MLKGFVRGGKNLCAAATCWTFNVKAVFILFVQLIMYRFRITFFTITQYR